MSIALRPLAKSDVAWLDAWLPGIANVAGCSDFTAASLIARLKTEGGLHARIVTRGTDHVGLAVYQLNTPKRASAMFELVATPAEHARKGAGMMAAAMIEEEMRASGIRTAYAPAAANRGISVYFWIRLGYAPLLRTDWPCEREGVTWLRRQLTH